MLQCKISYNRIIFGRYRVRVREIAKESERESARKEEININREGKTGCIHRECVSLKTVCISNAKLL